MDVKFIPTERKDGRFALGIQLNGKPVNWYVHWIETTTRRICKCSSRDLAFSVYSKDEAEAICDYLLREYESGGIE